ncbi:hypothetical protein [Blautia producta]
MKMFKECLKKTLGISGESYYATFTRSGDTGFSNGVLYLRKTDFKGK